MGFANLRMFSFYLRRPSLSEFEQIGNDIVSELPKDYSYTFGLYWFSHNGFGIVEE